MKRKRALQPLCGAKQEPGEGGVDVFCGVQPVGLVRGHLYPDLVVLLEFKHGTARGLVQVAFFVLVVGVGGRHVVLIKRHPNVSPFDMHVVGKVINAGYGAGEYPGDRVVAIVPVVQSPVELDRHAGRREWRGEDGGEGRRDAGGELSSAILRLPRLAVPQHGALHASVGQVQPRDARLVKHPRRSRRPGRPRWARRPVQPRCSWHSWWADGAGHAGFARLPLAGSPREPRLPFEPRQSLGPHGTRGSLQAWDARGAPQPRLPRDPTIPFWPRAAR